MIQFNNVVKTYERGNVALNGVTMQIEDGEFCFLVGPSGSGKSTIIRLITGELKPTSGSVHVNGYNLGTEHPRRGGCTPHKDRCSLARQEPRERNIA